MMGEVYIGSADGDWTPVGYVDAEDTATFEDRDETTVDDLTSTTFGRMPTQRFEMAGDLSLDALFGGAGAARPTYDVRVDAVVQRPDRRYQSRPASWRLGWWFDGLWWRLRGRPTTPYEVRTVLYGAVFDPPEPVRPGEPFRVTGRVTGRPGCGHRLCDPVSRCAYSPPAG